MSGRKGRRSATRAAVWVSVAPNTTNGRLSVMLAHPLEAHHRAAGTQRPVTFSGSREGAPVAVAPLGAGTPTPRWGRTLHARRRRSRERRRTRRRRGPPRRRCGCGRGARPCRACRLPRDRPSARPCRRPPHGSLGRAEDALWRGRGFLAHHRPSAPSRSSASLGVGSRRSSTLEASRRTRSGPCEDVAPPVSPSVPRPTGARPPPSAPAPTARRRARARVRRRRRAASLRARPSTPTMRAS